MTSFANFFCLSAKIQKLELQTFFYFFLTFLNGVLAAIANNWLFGKVNVKHCISVML